MLRSKCCDSSRRPTHSSVFLRHSAASTLRSADCRTPMAFGTTLAQSAAWRLMNSLTCALTAASACANRAARTSSLTSSSSSKLGSRKGSPGLYRCSLLASALATTASACARSRPLSSDSTPASRSSTSSFAPRSASPSAGASGSPFQRHVRLDRCRISLRAADAALGTSPVTVLLRVDA